jgi:pyruvate dehydrogenase E1 component beta subunit
MTELTLVQAVNRGLQQAMRDDPDVLLLGEDIGVNGGVFRATEGLLKEFGEDRVLDTPLSETGIVGTAIGMALYGLKPVAEIQFLDFIYPAFDQIVSELAKFRYRSGGQYPCHVVIRTRMAAGSREVSTTPRAPRPTSPTRRA